MIWDSRKQNWHSTWFGTAGNRVDTILDLGQQETVLAQYWSWDSRKQNCHNRVGRYRNRVVTIGLVDTGRTELSQ